jgi:hypothetical protein
MRDHLADSKQQPSPTRRKKSRLPHASQPKYPNHPANIITQLCGDKINTIDLTDYNPSQHNNIFKKERWCENLGLQWHINKIQKTHSNLRSHYM